MSEQLGTRAPETAGRSVRATSAAGASQGMAVLSYLLGGMVVYGGLGWAGWQFLHQLWMVPVGIVIGIGLALLLIVRRFSRGDVIDDELRQLIAQRDRDRDYWTAEARRGGSS